MGGNASKEEESKSNSYDVKCMYYDEDGNVRVGKKPKGKREDELKRVVDADTSGLEAEKPAEDLLENVEEEVKVVRLSLYLGLFVTYRTVFL